MAKMTFRIKLMTNFMHEKLLFQTINSIGLTVAESAAILKPEGVQLVEGTGLVTFGFYFLT